MVFTDGTLKLPAYCDFSQALASLDLPISCSELHGVLCGYLAADNQNAGDLYLRALLAHRESTDTQIAAIALSNVYNISQQQLSQLGFDFQLMLPADDTDLAAYARAFSEWCEGFTQGLTVAGINFDSLPNVTTREAIQHVTEFAQLDYDAVRVGDEDERALSEVIEYTRMAVLSIHADICAQHDGRPNTQH